MVLKMWKIKKKLWYKVSSIMSSVEATWCVFGDFNEFRGAMERRNSQLDHRGVSDFNEYK